MLPKLERISATVLDACAASGTVEASHDGTAATVQPTSIPFTTPLSTVVAAFLNDPQQSSVLFIALSGDAAVKFRALIDKAIQGAVIRSKGIPHRPSVDLEDGTLLLHTLSLVTPKFADRAGRHCPPCGLSAGSKVIVKGRFVPMLAGPGVLAQMIAIQVVSVALVTQIFDPYEGPV